MVFYNLVEDLPIYDLRCVELKYEEARHVAQTIWWLSRVRTWTENEDFGPSYSCQARTEAGP